MGKVIDLDALSDDAKVIASCWFSRMRVESPRSGLTFEMRESRPAARTQTALEELVAKGVIATSPTATGGRYYAPLVDCFPAFRWFYENSERPELNFALVEPIPPFARATGTITMDTATRGADHA